MTSPGSGLSRVSPAQAVGWSIAFFVLTILTASLLAAEAIILLAGSTDAEINKFTSAGPEAMLLAALTTLASTGLFTWLIGVRRLGLTWQDLRYTRGRWARTALGLGLVAGSVTAAVAILLSVVAGDAGWVDDTGTPADYLRQAIKTIAILAPAAFSEEALFRGVPLVLLAGVFGRATAVVGVAVLFALMHLPNPNATPLGLGNIALAGIFLGLAFYTPGGIWAAFGAHLGWNLLLACLDAPVSGVPFEIPMLDYVARSPAWLTGGAFGPEGGIAATIALTLAIIVTGRWAAKERL